MTFKLPHERMAMMEEDIKALQTLINGSILYEQKLENSMEINFYFNSNLENIMTALKDEITELKAAVAEQTSVTESAVTLIAGLAEKLKKALEDLANAGVTPEDLQDLNDLEAEMRENTAELVAAVQANTPAEEPPVEEQPAE